MVAALRRASRVADFAGDAPACAISFEAMFVRTRADFEKRH